MKKPRAAYKFTVTIHTDDPAVLNCLRGLAMHTQKEGSPFTSWGGTGEKYWKRDKGNVTFRFTSRDFCSKFLAEAKRLLPTALWHVVDQPKDDIALEERRSRRR